MCTKDIQILQPYFLVFPKKNLFLFKSNTIMPMSCRKLTILIIEMLTFQQIFQEVSVGNSISCLSPLFTIHCTYVHWSNYMT